MQSEYEIVSYIRNLFPNVIDLNKELEANFRSKVS